MRNWGRFLMEERKKYLKYAVATHTIEKLFPSEDALRLCEQVSDGVLDANDAIESILKKYDLKRVPAHG